MQHDKHPPMHLINKFIVLDFNKQASQATMKWAEANHPHI